MSSAVRLFIALLVAAGCAWLLGRAQPGLALLGWLPCAGFAGVGLWFNRFALNPGRPPMLALAGQVVRVFALAVVLVVAQRVLADASLAFVKGALGAFAVLWLNEIVDLVLFSRREMRGPG